MDPQGDRHFFPPSFSSAYLFIQNLKKNRDQETPSQYGCRPGAANFSG